MFTLTIQTDNEAFQPGPDAEVARILRAVADRIEVSADSYGLYQTVFDVNGNDVGRWRLGNIHESEK